MGVLKSYQGLVGPFFVGTQTVPAASGNQYLTVAHAIYNFASDGGAIATITPKAGVLLPARAILIGGVLYVATAPVGTGASVAIGTSAGSSSSSIMAATAITSLTAGALTALPAAPVRLTAAGNITFTISGAALAAGILEVFVNYIPSTN